MRSFVDYSGKKPCLVSSSTGEVTEVELFVAVLGASNYTYAEATHTQQVPDFIGSHMRALAFYGGVPRITVPDNLKSGVTKVCRYEPTLQRSYEDFANHYGTAVIPARPYKPRDKAKVEVAVQIAQRWILGRLRNRVFHSLSALNAAIRDSMVDLNARVMRDYKASRREMYKRFDRPALLALPADRFDVTEWKLVTVNIDYHVVFDERYYSVPHTLSHEKLWVRATATTVEILRAGKRIAAHLRRGDGKFSTVAEHMPRSHREQAEWTPSRILGWAEPQPQEPHRRGVIRFWRAPDGGRRGRPRSAAERSQDDRVRHHRNERLGPRDVLLRHGPVGTGRFAALRHGSNGSVGDEQKRASAHGHAPPRRELGDSWQRRHGGACCQEPRSRGCGLQEGG